MTEFNDRYLITGFVINNRNAYWFFFVLLLLLRTLIISLFKKLVQCKIYGYSYWIKNSNPYNSDLFYNLITFIY